MEPERQTDPRTLRGLPRGVKVLFVVSRFPYPLVQGDRVRAYHQLRILSREHRITLVTPIQRNVEEAGLEAIAPFCERIEVVPDSPWRRAVNLAAAPFCSKPLQVLYYYNREIERTIKRLVSNEAFDVIHVQLARMAPVLDRINRLPKVIDLIDAYSVNMSRRAAREAAPMGLVAALEARRLRRYERQLARRFDQMIVCSPLDAAAIGPFVNLRVARQGVDLERYRFVEQGRAPATIVFSGRLGYFPNADALDYFTTEVLPLVRSQIPEVEFVAVGGQLPAPIRRRCRRAGVILTGYVPDVNIHLQKATLAVAPMRSGSGMQFKVLEAMATGTPIAATPCALGGLDVIAGQHLLVAETASDFADNTVALLRSAPLRNRLAHNARRLVEQQYSWERSVEELIESYRLATSRQVAQPDGAERSLGEPIVCISSR
jgi:sugar transferase (PEP-CTERM/EpsH1 system associated)